MGYGLSGTCLFQSFISHIYICYLPAGRSVLEKKIGTVFPSTDRPRPAITCLFFSVGSYFITNICVDFLLKQFHTERVRWTFLEVWFLRLDNKIHFRYDSCHYPNP